MFSINHQLKTPHSIYDWSRNNTAGVTVTGSSYITCIIYLSHSSVVIFQLLSYLNYLHHKQTT